MSTTPKQQTRTRVKRAKPAPALATDRTAKQSVLLVIRKYGANGTILALAEALRGLGTEWQSGPEWQGVRGPADAIEAVAKVSPRGVEDDWRWAARCGDCDSCQEYAMVPNPYQACSGRVAQGSYNAGHGNVPSEPVKEGPAHPTGGFAQLGCVCDGCCL